MAGRDDIQALAMALKRPGSGYIGRIEAVRGGLGERAGEVSRQLGMFVDRIADLSTDELRELHMETFEHDAPGIVSETVRQLAHRPAGAGQAGAALEVLAPWLDRLEAHRNPFAHPVKGLCCLLLARLMHSDMEHSSR